MLVCNYLTKCDLKNSAATNREIQEFFKELDVLCESHLLDHTVSTFSGIVKIHPTKNSSGLLLKSLLFRFIRMSTTNEYTQSNEKHICE